MRTGFELEVRRFARPRTASWASTHAPARGRRVPSSSGLPMSKTTPSPGFTRSSNAVRHSSTTHAAACANPTTVPTRTPRLLGNRPRTSFWWFVAVEEARGEPAAEGLREVEFLAARQVEVASRRAPRRSPCGRSASSRRRTGPPFSRPSILKRDTPASMSGVDQVVGGEVLRAEQVARSPRSRRCRRRSSRRAAGRPGRTGRGWRCGRRAPRWSGTGRCRRRTARRGRTPPPARRCSAVTLRMSSSDSSRARTTRSTPSFADELDAARLGERHLRGGVDGQRRGDAADEPRRGRGPAR